MHIVIAHFHLQTGGVTRVIEHASAALTRAGHRVLVVAGEPPQEPLPRGVAFGLVPALAYEEQRLLVGPRELAAALELAAFNHLGDEPDLWHVHNHSLGKNLALPGALVELARRGQRLLLQPHDFAEDGRPALYSRMLSAIGEGDAARLSNRLYPLTDQIHYAVLNDRDLGFLRAAGIPQGQLHLLPNAVAIPATPARATHPFGERRLWLYPTRAIRRKNLGELLLWSTLAGEQDVFATTQAPQNPAERPRYRQWAKLVYELNLPVELELGQRVDDFPALLASAHALVTTSVAEGFGLAFLEPWLVRRPLAGRDIPEITRDFATAGLDLTGLYKRLEVPLAWLDLKRLRSVMEQTLQEVMIAYGRKGTPADLDRLWSSVVRDARIDFGRLDETAQAQVIRHLSDAPADRAAMQPGGLSSGTDAKLITRNRSVARRNYSIAGYGKRLEQIYGALLAASVKSEFGAADATALLDRFLAPERLYLLRS